MIGDDTARDLASKFQNNDSEAALAYMSRTSMKTMASANIPASRVHVSGRHHRPHGRGWRKRRLSDLGLDVHDPG